MTQKVFIRRKQASISRPLVRKILDKLIEQRDTLDPSGVDYKNAQSLISEVFRELEDDEALSNIISYDRDIDDSLLNDKTVSNNELEFDNLEDFFSSIISYHKDIGGKVFRSDKIPFIGVIVCNEDGDNEKWKYFLIKLQKAKECLTGGYIIPQELKHIFPSVKNTTQGDVLIVLHEGLYESRIV